MSSGAPLEDTGSGGDEIPGAVVDLCKRMTGRQLTEKTRDKEEDTDEQQEPRNGE